MNNSILVSACLIGINCRYNNQNCKNENVIRYLKTKYFIPICPEQLGGLETPRKCCEIVNGTGADVLSGTAYVVNESGKVITNNIINGAEEVLKITKFLDIKEAVLKSKSPSCGKGIIYDGTFSRKSRKGNGVTAEILLNYGINIKSENDFLTQE